MVEDINQRILLEEGDFCAMYKRMNMNLADGWAKTWFLDRREKGQPMGKYQPSEKFDG